MGILAVNVPKIRSLADRPARSERACDRTAGAVGLIALDGTEPVQVGADVTCACWCEGARSGDELCWVHVLECPMARTSSVIGNQDPKCFFQMASHENPEVARNWWGLRPWQSGKVHKCLACISGRYPCQTERQSTARLYRGGSQNDLLERHEPGSPSSVPKERKPAKRDVTSKSVPLHLAELGQRLEDDSGDL